MFDELERRESTPMVFLRKATIIFVGAFLVLGLVSAYRAWLQVRHLELKTSETVLRNGSTVETEVVSSGRNRVDVHLELIQGTHSETLGVLNVRGSELAFFDPRSRHATQRVTISTNVITRFQSGEAQLRATAIGRPQWGRTPPPLVRELRVEIAKL